MQLYYRRSTIDKMKADELKDIHRTYIIVIISILLICGVVSLLSIWDYIGSMWRYTMLVFIALLWPWIMQASYMAKKKKEVN